MERMSACIFKCCNSNHQYISWQPISTVHVSIVLLCGDSHLHISSCLFLAV
jgi:hypothetical protein